MTLLDDFARKCVILNKQRISDGEGGYEIVWSDGAEFSNFAALDTSMEARQAEKLGVTSVYSVLVEKDVPIEYGDYYREMESGKTYRVTSNPAEKQAPASASPIMQKLKFFTAERKELPQ